MEALLVWINKALVIWLPLIFYTMLYNKILILYFKSARKLIQLKCVSTVSICASKGLFSHDQLQGDNDKE